MVMAAKEDEKQPQQETVYVDMSIGQALRVLSLGAFVGLITWGLYFVLETYVLRAIMCQDGQTVGCATNGYAEVIAVILASGIGLMGLVKSGIFRPLLVVLTTVISLWGVFGIMSILPWYFVGLYVSLLYATSYLLFAWLARVRSFVAAVILSIAIVAVVRYILYF
jgi:hypothetical protein